MPLHTNKKQQSIREDEHLTPEQLRRVAYQMYKDHPVIQQRTALEGTKEDEHLAPEQLRRAAYKMYKDHPVIQKRIALERTNQMQADSRVASLPSETRISEISMLGTHDSGTYMYSRKRARGLAGKMALGELLPSAFKTQKLDLVEQAQAGARYFDIRIKKNAQGSWGFFHGPSQARGDAVKETRALLAHAQKDAGDLYIFKFVFKGDQQANEFFEQAIEDYKHRFISSNTMEQLGSVTIGDSIEQNKNMAALVNGGSPEGFRDIAFDYRSNVHTEWGNMSRGAPLAQHIEDFSYQPKRNEDDITITQTNMPVFSKKNKPPLHPGIRSVAESDHKIVADAVDRVDNPGIISIDYIDTPYASTDRYKEIIKRKNTRLSGAKSPTLV